MSRAANSKTDVYRLKNLVSSERTWMVNKVCFLFDYQYGIQVPRCADLKAGPDRHRPLEVKETGRLGDTRIMVLPSGMEVVEVPR